MIRTMTPQEAAEVLRQHGMRISPDTLRYGLEQGVYPFGLCIQCDKQPVYQIFAKLLYQWIAERCDGQKGGDDGWHRFYPTAGPAPEKGGGLGTPA